MTISSKAPASGSERRGGGRRAAFACSAVLSLVLPQAAHAATDDPWEPANRTFFMVHQVLDGFFFGKVVPIFRSIPAPIRTAVRNVIANLTEPGVAANDLLQGHPEVMVRTVGRLAVNTTVGLGGMIDVASGAGLPHHDNGFANTFGRWGAPPGPYLFITMVGPTTVRDGAGTVADILTDPFTWARFYHRWTAIDVRAVWSGLDERTEQDMQLRAIDNMSTDPYASLRSLYLQNRAAVIASPPGAEQGGSTTLPALPDFGDPAAPAAPDSPAPTAQPPPPGPAAELQPPRAPDDPSSEVLAANRRDARLLAALSAASQATL
mgnify:CR=1 FL=1